MKKYFLPILIALSALSISAAAAYYSVTGLAKLFAGVETAVIWMASSLEVAKLVVASLLYQYWKELNKTLKGYLIIALATLMIITSAGIYGYLSSGYQDTANKSSVVDKEITLVENKIKNKEADKVFTLQQLTSTQQSISQLRNALGNNNQTYKDKQGNILTTTSSANRKSYEKQLEFALKDEKILSNKVNVIDSTLSVLSEEKLAKESNSELAGELGPLKYIAKLTNTAMDKIINWFLMIIIFVFDPLAISLVIAANFAFNQIKNPKELSIYNEKPVEVKPIVTEHKVDDSIVPTPPPAKSWYNYIQPAFNKKRDDDVRLTRITQS
jgi:hypothetical protein